MAFEYGFYNSINGDRKYNAIQFSQIFDGVIMDGVFASIGDKLFTTANGGMEIAVGTGKAWFNHTWNLNTTKMIFTLAHSHAVLSRYDAVVLEVNEEQNAYGRVNAIKVIEGTPSSNATKPTMINSQYIHQYPLAYIKINAAAEAITAADIEITVGTSPCPFVTGILQTADISGLFANWNQQFDTWFDNLKAQLTDNVVANLQAQIDVCLKPTDIATSTDITAGVAGKIVDAAGLKNNSYLVNYQVGDIVSTQRALWCMDTTVAARFYRCDGTMYKTKEFPEWYNIVKNNFNKYSRIMTGCVKYGVASIKNGSVVFPCFTLSVVNGNDYFCHVSEITPTAFTYYVNDIEIMWGNSYTVNFRNNIDQKVLFNIIKRGSIKGKNKNNAYFLLTSGSKISVIEFRNEYFDSASTDVTEFYRDLSLDGMTIPPYLKQHNSYVVLEDDTFHVYYTDSSYKLSYFSFYLDRVNKEVRLVTNITAVPVLDSGGSPKLISFINCPGVICDSGNIYINATSVNSKELLCLKIVNKNTCSVFYAIGTPDSNDATYTYPFYNLVLEETYSYLTLYSVGMGNENNGAYNILIGAFKLDIITETIAWYNLLSQTITTSTFPDINLANVYKAFFRGQCAIGCVGEGDLCIYYRTFAVVIHSDLLLNSFANPVFFVYRDIGGFAHGTKMGWLVQNMYDFGYFHYDFCILSDPVNNVIAYYPELATPAMVGRTNTDGYDNYIRVKT